MIKLFRVYIHTDRILGLLYNLTKNNNCINFLKIAAFLDNVSMMYESVYFRITIIFLM